MDLTAITLDTIFQYIGLLSTISFALVAFGDFVTASLNIIVKRSLSKDDDERAARILYKWETIKEIYEELRKFIDRFSSFSRPRQ